MSKLELRFKPVDLSAAQEGDDLKVEGYVNLTDQPSEELSTYSGHRFIEKISKGAFSKALQRATEIDFLVEHDKERILSTTRNNSLNLVEDDKGLFMSATISATSWGKDYYTLIKDGIIKNFSFGFKAINDQWDERRDGLLERTVYDMDLFEVSLVKNPAYTQSYVEARSSDYMTTDEVLKRGEEMSAEEKVEKNDSEKKEEVEEVDKDELKRLADSFEELINQLKEKQLLIDDEEDEEDEADVEKQDEKDEQTSESIEEESTEEERALPEDVQEDEDKKDEENLKTTIIGLELKVEKIHSMLEEVLNDKNREIDEDEDKKEDELKEEKEAKKEEKQEKSDAKKSESSNLKKLKETIAGLNEYDV